MYLTSRLSTLLILSSLLSFTCSAAIEPASPKPVKEGEVSLFDDMIAPIGPEDVPNDGKAIIENDEEKYKRGRMAFLFGQYDSAYKIWQPMAVQGYAKAQASLGWMYHTGQGAKKSYRTAYDWYEKAAKQNHPIALNNLGVFHEQGLSVGQSMELAFKWYKESAEWGYSYAQYNLGVLYKTGRGVKKDLNKAIYWLELATLQGVEQAQEELESLSSSAESSHPASRATDGNHSGKQTSADTKGKSAGKHNKNWHGKE